MTRMFKFLRLIRIEEWVALASSGVVTLINILVYRNNFSVGGTTFLMFKYFSFGTPFFEVFFLFIWGFCFWRLYLWLVRAAQSVIDKNGMPLKESFERFILEILSALRVFAPFIVVSIAFYQLLDNFSYQLRFKGADMFLASLDQKLFGEYPFVWLATAFHQSWFSWLMFYIYIYLSVVLSGVFILLFFFSSNLLFRRAILSFIIILVIAFPLFYFLPCQDPNNYFLRDIRGYSFTPEVSVILKSYAPSVLTAGYISQIAEAETNAKQDNAVPVSCFPSMHATWSLLIVYFLAKLWKRSLFVSLPWLAFLLLSGIYLAQHYVVDYVIAVPVAVIGLFIANFLIRQKPAVETVSTAE